MSPTLLEEIERNCRLETSKGRRFAVAQRFPAVVEAARAWLFVAVVVCVNLISIAARALLVVDICVHLIFIADVAATSGLSGFAVIAAFLSGSDIAVTVADVITEAVVVVVAAVNAI